MRTGQQYIDSLRDGRKVFLDGEEVPDITEHPAFANAIRVIARAYESRHTAQGYTPARGESGEAFDPMWLIPHTREDLRLRRESHLHWARVSHGLMGRSPDHVASVLTGFVASQKSFAKSSPELAANLVSFYERARREDLYLSYVIVPPQYDRSKPAHQQAEPYMSVGVCEEREDGIVLRGAQMIGSAAVISDYVFVSYGTPLAPGDEDYAFSAMVPINAAGVKLYPRRPYAADHASRFDYPLTSGFDETDAMIVFDDVFVPWKEVFVYRDIEMCRQQFFATGSHELANLQSLVRLGVKLDFICGLTRELVAHQGLDKIPPVLATLGGQIATVCVAIKALAMAAESEATINENGWLHPKSEYIFTGLSFQRKWMVGVNTTMRELAGGSPMAVPDSAATFDSDATRQDIERYFQAKGYPARDRIKFLKLYWDMVGTEFAGRQLQYEMFYSRPQHVVDSRVYDSFDWTPGLDAVRAFLATY